MSNQYVTATINHFENGVVLKASTSEWCIKKQLYKTKDTSAFINLARVILNLCLTAFNNRCNVGFRLPMSSNRSYRNQL